MMNVPEGFQPLFRSSPLLDLLGPFFCRQDAQRQLVVALRIDEKHCNHGGTAH
ncbi:PaaI family thioesterase, partial [Pseudomonas aeruginosa]|nr:PaaI family thioesterase [Pseudomonas aeruginosa]